jgi:hypothetical protein
VLVLAGVGFVGFGAAYALRPRGMGALTDVSPMSPTAGADFVATYGGFQIGFGLFLLACARRPEWLEPGLWAVVAALGGFGALRALTILVHGGPVRRTIWLALGLEMAGAALSLWALGRLG